MSEPMSLIRANVSRPIECPAEACAWVWAGDASWVSASGVGPSFEDAGGADLYRHHFSVR